MIREDPGGPLLAWLHKPRGGHLTATVAVCAGDYVVASTELPVGSENRPHVADWHLHRLGYMRVGPWTASDDNTAHAKAVEADQQAPTT